MLPLKIRVRQLTIAWPGINIRIKYNKYKFLKSVNLNIEYTQKNVLNQKLGSVLNYKVYVCLNFDWPCTKNVFSAKLNKKISHNIQNNDWNYLKLLQNVCVSNIQVWCKCKGVS